MSKDIQFTIVGFIVGIDTEQNTLSIRPSNTIMEDNEKYAIGLIKSPKKAVLVKFKNIKQDKKSFINFKFKKNTQNLQHLCLALQQRGKVQLIVKSSQGQPFDEEECYITNIQWKD